jgi:hypothetical protein
MVRTLGFPYDFRPTPWEELLAATERRPQAAYLQPILRSVADSPARAHLAGAMWMNDLVVVATPVTDPPIDVLVSTFESLEPSGARHLIRIEHRSATGRNDNIERTPDEAVALFWRFVIEKFGVAPS